MKQLYKFIGLIFAVIGPFHSAAQAQQQMFARRSPTPPYWSFGVGGYGAHSSAQEVCDVATVIWELTDPLVYWPTTEHQGRCRRNPTDYSGLVQVVYGSECPTNYSPKNFVELCCIGVYYKNFIINGPNQYCESTIPYVDRGHDKPQGSGQPCGGNPIYPLTGNKRQSEELVRWSSSGPTLSISYDNRRKLPNSDPEGAFVLAAAASFGEIWESSLHKRLVIQYSSGNSLTYYQHIQASRGSGAWVSFYRRPSANEPQMPDSDIADRVVAITGGWRYTDASAQAQETYTSQGVLTALAYARGGSLTYSYSDGSTSTTVAPVAGLLVKIQDPYGRAVRLEYEQPTGVSAPRIVRVIDPDGQMVQVGYDAAGNLGQLAWPDGHMRKFLYEQSALPWALTGIVDENDGRYSTYAYDAEGRALSTEYAGGVNRYVLGYSSPPRWVTTESIDSAADVFARDHNWLAPEGAVMTTPNGIAVSYGTTVVNGMPRVTTRSQPAGAGCDASSSSLTYDANGNITSKTDFNGTKSCHAYDLSRNLETARLDGLGAADACPADIGAFTIAAEASQRKTTTQWHPTWSLPIKQAEPKKITISVYNGQPDPTAGNVTASCAPATALLPDGSRIAVLCKKVEQPTTDATASLGFNATVTGVPRTSTYTYNQYGQVLTARDPLNKLTTYAYHSDTTDQHTMGDLQSVTDSVGRLTQYTRYDKTGRLMQSIDANGTPTDTTYTPRGWVKTVTVTPVGAAAQASLYDYDGVGQLKKATLPDGSALEYTYDVAHRLTSVKDAAGNSVTYTLDNMGNRTGEDLKDPSGTLARNITRVYDALNRMQGATGMGQ